MENLQQTIIDLVRQYPNDLELGEKVRELGWNLINEVETRDPNQLKLWSEDELNSFNNIGQL